MDQNTRRHIAENIQSHGFHLYLVSGGQAPRFAYTIGLNEILGFEYIVAGCAYYSDAEIIDVINNVSRNCLLTHSTPEPSTQVANLGDFGSFFIRVAHHSWTSKIALGASDYYGSQSIKFFQLIPDEAHQTLDIPDMESPWDGKRMWQWLDAELPENLPRDALAVTDLDALQGYYITECTRWESHEWEIFSGNGPDVKEEDMRRLPLGVLLGIDPTIIKALGFEVGDLVHRTYEEKTWHLDR